MTTQQTKVDWSRPIEAIGPSGHVWKAEQVLWDKPQGFDRWVLLTDSMQKLPCNNDGLSELGWRVRNVAQPEVNGNSRTPTPSPELTARMVGLEEALTWIADFVAKKRQGTDDWFDLAEIEQVARRAITAELEPVDGDWEQAKRLTAELFPYAAPQNEHALWKMAHAGLKAGRALAEAGK